MSFVADRLSLRWYFGAGLVQGRELYFDDTNAKEQRAFISWPPVSMPLISSVLERGATSSAVCS